MSVIRDFFIGLASGVLSVLIQIFHFLIYILGFLAICKIFIDIFEYFEFLSDISTLEYIYLFTLGYLVRQYWKSSLTAGTSKFDAITSGLYFYGIYATIKLVMFAIYLWSTKSQPSEIHWIDNSYFKIVFMFLNVGVVFFISKIPQIIVEAELQQNTLEKGEVGNA